MARNFVNGEIYHIVNRSIGTSLFDKNSDYIRMIHNLYEFNDSHPAPSNYRVQCSRKENVTISEIVTLDLEKKKREKLVDILAFCLMPDHIHLLLVQKKENGISKFMRKIGVGYGNYFNRIHERKGHVFQGKFKAILILDSEQLNTVFVYIHTNPIALIDKNWKEFGVAETQKAVEFIENYRWSSYRDYLGIKNFPSLTSRVLFEKIFVKKNEISDFTNGWVWHKGEIAEDLKRVFLE